MTINGKEFITFRIIDLDVWGNEKEGFEVNNMHYTSYYISVSKDFDDKEIIRQLKQTPFLKKNFQFKSFTIEGESDFTLFIEHCRLGPVCYLERVKE